MVMLFGPEDRGRRKARYWMGYGASRTPTYVRAPDANTASRFILHYWVEGSGAMDESELKPLGYYLQSLGLDDYEVWEVSGKNFRKAWVNLGGDTIVPIGEVEVEGQDPGGVSTGEEVFGSPPGGLTLITGEPWGGEGIYRSPELKTEWLEKDAEEGRN